jgi:acyl-CoA thioesterase
MIEQIPAAPPRGAVYQEGFDHRFGRTMSVRAEVSKHERGYRPFDTSGRTDIRVHMAETMIVAIRRERTAMEHMKEFFKKDRFANSVGIELLEVSAGTARASMEIKDHHLNAVGIVHGAAIFTLADLVFAMASNSHGTVAVAVNVSISFLRAASGGTLFAEAMEVSRNSKLASYTIRVTDESDDLIAIFQGMVYRKRDKIPLE